jgi:hypothetical protein
MFRAWIMGVVDWFFPIEDEYSSATIIDQIVAGQTAQAEYSRILAGIPPASLVSPSPRLVAYLNRRVPIANFQPWAVFQE